MTFEPLPEKLTIGEAYRPAMEITDATEAHVYFERLVERQMRCFNATRGRAEEVERANLGYFAGYYDHETRLRVERLFACRHPVFGAAAEQGTPSVTDALEAGKRLVPR